MTLVYFLTLSSILLGLASPSEIAMTKSFLPCHNITLSLDPTKTYVGISRVVCSSYCHVNDCEAFRFKGQICDVEIEGLGDETTVLETDGCFATEGSSSPTLFPVKK